MTRRWLQGAVMAAALGSISAAWAVPAAVPYQGRLTYDGGGAFQGAANIAVALFPDATLGDALWSHSYVDVFVEGGIFSVVLGGGGAPPLPEGALDLAELWLEFTVQGEVLFPRQRVLSVPYALQAADAAALAGIDAAEYALQAELAAVASSGAYADLEGAPSLAAVATSGAYSDLLGTPSLAAVASSGAYGDLTGAPALAPVALSGAYADLTGKPALAAVATSGAYADLNGKPALSAVATTGAYADLIGKPNLAAVATSGAYSDLSGTPSLAAVATSGAYSDLSGTPNLSTYLQSSGSAASSLSVTNLNLPASGSVVNFGACSTLPAGFSEDTSATTDGWCMKTGTDGPDRETLFIVGVDNGADAEAVYLGGGQNCCGPNWRGMRVGCDGNARLTGSLNANFGAIYSDLAEHLPMEAEIPEGVVVVAESVDTDFARSRFVPASTPYDPAVVGVVSESHGLSMGPPDGRRPVALAGIVKVKVDADPGAIRPGDLLVSSATPGHAMRSARDVPGAVFGKALQAWTQGQGEILMLVMHR